MNLFTSGLIGYCLGAANNNNQPQPEPTIHGPCWPILLCILFPPLLLLVLIANAYDKMIEERAKAIRLKAIEKDCTKIWIDKDGNPLL